ncbi:MAG TPA: alpha/beta family hydrolase [Thermoanaerobaculia bacterium]
MPEFLIDGSASAARTYIFAPGAGGPMVSGFMTAIARGIAAKGIRVVRFEFPYMTARRRRPDPENVILDSWRFVVREIGHPESLVIGGKSFGGRMASMVADELQVAGLLCYGYPFHPPGQPAKLRTAHLKTLATPALIVQGSRDAFGSREEVESYELSKAIALQWIPEGDHSFKPRARSGFTERENLERAVDYGVRFITSI